MLNNNSQFKVTEVFLSSKSTEVKEETTGFLFSKNNFSKDWESIYVTPDQLNVGKVEKGMRKITTPAIVITTHSNKMAFLLASELHPIYIPGDLKKDEDGYLLAFRPSPLISPEYLYYMCQYDLWDHFTSQFSPNNGDGFCMSWKDTGFVWEGGVDTPYVIVSTGLINLPSPKEQEDRVLAAKRQQAKLRETKKPEYDVIYLVDKYIFEVRRKDIFSYDGIGLIAKLYQIAAGKEVNPKVIDILGQYKFYEEILSEEELSFLSYHIDDVFKEVISFNDIRLEPRIGFIQPQEVTDLICRLVSFSEDITVYNPFAGANSYAIDISNHVVGEELDEVTWALGQIRLYANNALDRATITLGDSFERMISETKYKGIIASPPFLKENGRDVVDIINNLYEKLEEGGRMACLVPGNVLHSNDKRTQTLRDRLIQEKALEMVIMLPSNIFTGSTLSQAVLIITRGISQDVVIFGDATGYTCYAKSAYRTTTFDKETFLEDLKEEITNCYECGDEINEDTIAYPVPYNDINSEYLTPSRYLLPRPNEGIALTQIAEEIKGQSVKEVTAKYFITGSSIPAAMHRKPFSPEKTSDGNVKTSKSQVLVPENSVILSLVSGKIRTVYTEDFTGVIAFPPGFIKVLKPKLGVSAKYLAAVLSTKIVADQIVVQTASQTIPRLNRVDFSQVIIPWHKTLDEQEKLISEVLSSEMSELESELQDKLESHKREVRSTRHAMIQTLSALSSNWEQLRMFAELKQEGLSLVDIIGRINPISVKDLMGSIGYAISTLQRQVEALRLEKTDWGKEEEIDPYSFINNFIRTHSSPSVKMINVGPKNEIDYPVLDENTGKVSYVHSDSSEWFYAPVRLLERIFNNIISNAKAHGFSGKKHNNEIRFDWESEDGKIIITIANNGKPLKEGVSGTDVLMSGFSTAFNENSEEGTLHSGQGGFEIKSLMDGLGTVEVISQPEEEFPVIYKLTFEKTNSVEL